MQHYKAYRIHTTAVFTKEGSWHGRGAVFHPQEKLVSEVYRIETANDLLFLTKSDAENFAFMLCKAWIDSTCSEIDSVDVNTYREL
jgi:hypothetical protein